MRHVVLCALIALCLAPVAAADPEMGETPKGPPSKDAFEYTFQGAIDDADDYRKACKADPASCDHWAANFFLASWRYRAHDTALMWGEDVDEVDPPIPSEPFPPNANPYTAAGYGYHEPPPTGWGPYCTGN